MISREERKSISIFLLIGPIGYLINKKPKTLFQSKSKKYHLKKRSSDYNDIRSQNNHQ
jgi:hypothetical protein